MFGTDRTHYLQAKDTTRSPQRVVSSAHETQLKLSWVKQSSYIASVYPPPIDHSSTQGQCLCTGLPPANSCPILEESVQQTCSLRYRRRARPRRGGSATPAPSPSPRAGRASPQPRGPQHPTRSQQRPFHANRHRRKLRQTPTPGDLRCLYPRRPCARFGGRGVEKLESPLVACSERMFMYSS